MDGSYVEERSELEKERQELEKERRTLQQERESFAEAAIRLNREVRAVIVAFNLLSLGGMFLYATAAVDHVAGGIAS